MSTRTFMASMVLMAGAAGPLMAQQVPPDGTGGARSSRWG